METMLLVALASASRADEIAFTQAWALTALLGEPACEEPPPVGLELQRQDAGELTLRQSVRKTPLQIGSNHYAHGIGTHANSRLVLHLAKPGKLFEAAVGVDNNWDTAGKHGTVVFSVSVGGKILFRSDVLKGGQEPVSVRVELAGAKDLTLELSDAGDGISWDQADWADAKVTYADGTSAWVDEMPLTIGPARLGSSLPFSFTYGGKSSAELLSKWEHSVTRRRAKDGKEVDSITYTDPETGLQVSADVTLFSYFPATEWVVRFKNTGKMDTPILENIHALDLGIDTPAKGDVVLHYSHGSTCTSTDFIPIDAPLAPGASVDLTPNGGRSSDGVLPFFNLQWHDGGMIGAIGWSGQWSMHLQRADRQLALQAGQQTTHLTLHPGESIRTPRMLLMPWRGPDRYHGHNLLRRLLLAHYCLRVNGEVALPLSGQLAVNQDLNWCNEQSQIEQMPRMAKTGIEMFWLDAGWFEGDWPMGVGSWVPKSAFPRGLKPLGDATHANGMKFILWFEPERVARDSRIGKDTPGFVRWWRDDDPNGLFKLDDPAARKWLTDHLSKCIADWGVDVYRNDFNIDPLRFWQAADAPDRQGITENHYIEGLYTMWDELLRRKPGLTIDDCASGGRRIDLETMSRSYPLWRSDTTCGPPVSSAWDQCQTAGLSLWIPLHAAGTWSFDPYPFRSVATMAVNPLTDIWRKDYPFAAAKKALAEVKELRPLWLGDYYPLLPITLDESHWCGWQFHRADLGKGFAMLFRRPQSPYPTADVPLHGLEPTARYAVTFADTKQKRTMTGAQLAHFSASIPAAPGTLLVKYARLAK